MSTAAAPERDPGLQPERTRLAWRRTTLSATVAAVLAGKTALHSGSASGIVSCALCCTLWLAFLVVAHLRMRALEAPEPGPDPRFVVASALGTVALAVCAAVLVF
ncbi:DUF202 domain-containing protein [Streptomyces sp. NPDC090306]|uniref:DUF202 domain-containing protein n=1 Tax=unclassified Streptomyces TaxID=2593676 RepID=UPI0036E6FA17